jgi:curved DNA-binding protein CbpA
VQGQLGDSFTPILIRDLAEKGASGLLRLSHGKNIKAIFFEAGSPVFAISNLSADQLETRLLQKGLATPEQIQIAKDRADNPNRLGSILVEQGVLSRENLRVVVRDQVMEIIRSTFDWSEGEFVFDERIRAAHDVTIDCTTQDVILDGMRHCSRSGEIASTIAPTGSFVAATRASSNRGASGKLLPVESYVLSRVDSPTRVEEIAATTGMAEEDANRTICTLIAAGFLKVVPNDVPMSEVNQSHDSQLSEEVSRKLHFYTTADYYEVLGVTRNSSSGEIKKSYYQLAKKFHPDRHRQPEHTHLRTKLEALFARITQAYETLSEPALRGAYDTQLKRSPTSPSVDPPIAESHLNPELAQHSIAAAAHTAPSNGSAGPPAEDSDNQEQNSSRSGSTPGLSAEQLYKQGRARYDRHEYHAAVHLLREAVRLDPSKPAYHYHLGIALVRNPRTRREAEQHLSKAAELEPYNAQVRAKLGTLYKEAGLLKKSEHYLNEALSLDPENKLARRELGVQPARKKKEDGSTWKANFGTLAKRLFRKA